MELAKTGTASEPSLDVPGRAVLEKGWVHRPNVENVMAFQSVPDCAQIDVVFTQNGVTLQNSFYAFHPGGYSLSDLEALAADIDAAIPITWLPRMSDACTYLRTDVRGLDTENDLVATDNTSTAAGDDATVPLPNNVSFSMKKVSGLTGRSARGRTYWCSIPRDKVDAVDENRLQTTYITNILSAVDSIRLNIESVGTWEAKLVSRFLNGVKRDEGITFPWIDTVAVNEVVDTQRGRLPG